MLQPKRDLDSLEVTSGPKTGEPELILADGSNSRFEVDAGSVALASKCSGRVWLASGCGPVSVLFLGLV